MRGEMKKRKKKKGRKEDGQRIIATIVKATSQDKHDFGGQGKCISNKRMTVQRLPQRIDNECLIAVCMCIFIATLRFKVHIVMYHRGGYRTLAFLWSLD